MSDPFPSLHLFGGDQPWNASLWVAQDDRVRGGSSTSHLTVLHGNRACFHGHLDTKTLGGAGFASQRTQPNLDLDLSAYDDGLWLSVGRSDNKRYAITLKDEVPPKRPDGRDNSGLSWQAEFVVPASGGSGPELIHLPWTLFQPTYRGRPKLDAEPLDLSSIKRIGLMMRSFFDKQDGDFTLELYSIAAKRKDPNISVKASEQARASVDDEDGEDDDIKGELPLAATTSPKRRAWYSVLLCGLV